MHSTIHTAQPVNVTMVSAHPPALSTEALQQTVKHMTNTELAQ